MTTPHLTIGMACHSDFYGVDMTVQALRLYHAEAMPQCEIVIVDNSPQSPHAQEIRGLAGWCYGRTPEACARTGETPSLGGFQYLAMPEPVGTAAPRDRIFRAARGEWVLCVDSHVLLWPGSIARLIAWTRANPGCQDLLSGPLVYDGLDTCSTHFDDVWRSAMWGTWGSAWACPGCGHHLAPRQVPDSQVAWHDLVRQTGPLVTCPGCERELPQGLPWSQHERALTRLGFREVAADLDAPPFEIPAQGLGLFGCRRDSWLGFNGRFRAFGGEEWYIHEKYRQAGRRCLSLPFLRWRHRFGRVEKSTYPNSNWYKCRNYVLGHAELGLPLDRVRSHFVGGRMVPPHEWEQLAATPHDPPEWPAGLPRPGQPVAVQPAVQAATVPVAAAPLLSRVEALRQTQHDFRHHEGWLLRLASEANHATEMGGRRGSSTVCLLAGLAGGRGVDQARTYRLIDPQAGSEWEDLAVLAAGVVQMIHTPGRSETAEVLPTDLLLIDTEHYAGQLRVELSRHAPAVSRRIVLHDTVLHGIRGENGQPGILGAIREFCEQYPEWFVMAHDSRSYGLTTLSRHPDDRPAKPILPWQRLDAEGNPVPAPPGRGPGTELKGILAGLGIQPGRQCDCNARAVQMDRWGVSGCREHREEIIGWLRTNQGRWGWREKVTAAARAVTSGLAFRLNPVDPYPGLVDEAIRRAAVRELQEGAGVQQPGVKP